MAGQVEYRRSKVGDHDAEATADFMPALDIAKCTNDTYPRSGMPVRVDSLTDYESTVAGFCNPGGRDKIETALPHFDEANSSRGRQGS